MKATSARYGWDEDLSEYGELVREIDGGDGWDVDIARLYKKGRKYSVLMATGCSCFDGEYEGWTELTKAELVSLANKWKDAFGAERRLGSWIVNGMKPEENA